MKFALDIPNFGDFADVRIVAEVAAAAESGGWDGVFLWDHLAQAWSTDSPPPTADVTVALTAVALATTRVRFGALVTPLPRRRVQKVAREIASLDRLSNGRVVCGAGLGYPPDEEFEAFGEDGRDAVRAARLDESLSVLDALWRGERVDYDGRYLHVHAPPFLPTPVQRPRVPVWVAATWPGRAGPLRRAARWDGIVPIPADPTSLVLQPDDVRALRAAVGRDDAAFDVVITPGHDGDPRAYADAGATWWLSVAFTRADALRCAREGPPRVP